MVKKIPIGVNDFKELRSDNYFYIDKSQFIEEIINDGAAVKLFTRPQSFGKSLNLSMLQYFFDIREAGENKKLFDNLYIKNSQVFAHQGKYPVIFISFKDLISETYDDLIAKLQLKISKLFSSYKDLIASLDKFETAIFEKMLLGHNLGPIYLSGSLSFLTKILHRHYKQKVVVLIDDYDTPLTNASVQ